MNKIYEQFLDIVSFEKEVILELLKIDNRVQNTNVTYDDFYNMCSAVLMKDKVDFNLTGKVLFVTEGSPFITLEVLKNIMGTENEYVLFINRSFVGLNKWLCKKFIELTGDIIKLELDIDANYNKYLDKDYNVVTLGEDGLIKAVREDFEG